jgi:hypothetical protein
MDCSITATGDLEICERLAASVFLERFWESRQFGENHVGYFYFIVYCYGEALTGG